MSRLISVTVIGAGVMGEALIAALISFGVAPSSIAVIEKRKARGDELIDRYGISVGELETSVPKAEIILLVVKPADMADLLAQLKPLINPDCLIVSFAAGKKLSFISDGLATANPLMRVMPNTATIVGAGMAAISCGPGVTPQQREFVFGFLGATGKVVELPEDLQDAVTATSGSGPAYFFRFVEAMVAGAQALGLSHEVATELTVQTIIGAAKLLELSGKSATTLRENVTSPNGTTAAALASLEEAQISTIIVTAMKAARDRSQELA